MSYSKRLKFWGIASLIGLFIFVVSLLALLLVYIIVSWYEKDKPPADFNIKIPYEIEQGGSFIYDVTDIVRHKICPYRRFVSITDSNGVTQNMQEVPGYPPVLLGVNPDIYVNMKLDPRLVPGEASMDVLVEYTCPGNFFHAVLNEPYLARRNVKFVIVQKQGK